mgnify:CR=1 FL=1
MCEFYMPWNRADPYPLAMAECVSYGAHDGLCDEPMSHHSGEPCHEAGYPFGLDSEARTLAAESRLK